MPANANEVVLVVTDDCPACERAREIWARGCAERAVALRVHRADAAAEAGLDTEPALTTVPAVVVGGRVVAVGLQTPAQVNAILDRYFAAVTGR